MSDRLSRIEARLGGIDQALADVYRRIEALEAMSCVRRQCAMNFPLPPSRRPRWRHCRSRAGPTFPLSSRSSAGRLSCSEARTFCALSPNPAGFPGAPVSCWVSRMRAAWFGAADRAGRTRPLSGLFHGLAAVVISLPLIWEASAHFKLLSPATSAATLSLDYRSRARRRLASPSAEPGRCCHPGIDRRDGWTRGGDVAPAAICCGSAGARCVHLVAERRALVAMAPVASGFRRRPPCVAAGREIRRSAAARSPRNGDRAAARVRGHLRGLGGLAHARSPSADPCIRCDPDDERRRDWTPRRVDRGSRRVQPGLARARRSRLLGAGAGYAAAFEILRRRSDARANVVFFSMLAVVLLLIGSARDPERPGTRGVVRRARRGGGCARPARVTEPQLSLHAAVLGVATAIASGVLVWAAQVWFTTAPWPPGTAAHIATVVVAAACLAIPPRASGAPAGVPAPVLVSVHASSWRSCSSSGAAGSRCTGLPRSSPAILSMPACLRA